MAHVLVQSFGTRGDIEPFIALGRGLQRRGHRVTFASTPYYRAIIERAGLTFQPVRPYLNPADKKLIQQSFHPLGFRTLLSQMVFPAIEQTFVDTQPLIAEADVFVAGSLCFLGPLLHHSSGVAWLRCVLQPSLFLSEHDPPTLTPYRAEHLVQRQPALHKYLLRELKRDALRWARPLLDLEHAHGFQRQDVETLGHPIFGLSSHQTLALFSQHFAAVQPDWPPNTRCTGFLFSETNQGLEAGLERFLANGDAPLVFTFGSVGAGASLWQTCIRAAKAVGKRAVIIGNENGQTSNEDVYFTPAVPYGALFPHVAAVIHHGGIGTLAQALRAGQPMLVVPFGQDQWDNAKRTERLGIGLMIRKHGTIREALSKLLSEPSYADSAQTLAQKLAGEDGLKAACEAVEDVLE